MKNARRLTQLLVLAFCATTCSVRGTIFDFSYNFGDGLKVSGALTGTQNGLFVENILNVSLAFNGTPVPGSIFASKYDSTLGYLSGPVVSFDVFQNNFVFSNSNLAGGDFGYDSLFYVLNASVADNTAVGMSIPLGHFGSQDLPTVISRWSLTTASAPSVPDEGAAAALLGMAMVGMVWLRRRR